MTNSSKLPFRIEPGTDDNAIYIDSTGDIGFGTNAPGAALDVRRSTGGNATLLNLRNNAPVSIVLDHTTSDEPGSWEIRRSNNGLSFDNGTAGTDVLFDDDGSVRFRRGDGSGGSTDSLVMDTAGNVTALSFTGTSDRNLKENFVDVDQDEILEKIAALPMTRWNFIAEGQKVQHIGPMAQDFHAAFGLGLNERTIATTDADGVALAAIQALYQQLQAKKAELETVHQRLEALEAKLAQ